MAQSDAATSAEPSPGIFGSKDLVGQVALVTGGSRGIGKAIAMHLASRGASVAINYQARKDAAEKVGEEAQAKGFGTVKAYQADVTKVEEIKALFDAVVKDFGKLSIFVNNAGTMDFSAPKIQDMSDESINKTIDTNVKGALTCLREAGKRIADGGRIVAISSTLAIDTNPGFPMAAYGGSKAALETFAKCMAPEMRGRRVTVNAVAPGPIMTDFFFANSHDEKSIEASRLKAPLERHGLPEDVANVVGFLCSREAEWVNGQVIRANGGYFS